MYTLRYFSYLRERKYHFQVLREKEMKMNFIMNISKCFTKRRSNLVLWVFALGERNTLVWSGHVTRGFCVKWHIVVIINNNY